jgi:hypothetical protein
LVSVFILAIHPTNDFNKISLLPTAQLTVAQQNILMTMALNGDSIVNPFGDVVDAAGLTPEGRARKEREEEEQFRQTMAQLEERRLEFQRELDRMEQGDLEALHENEEQLREARKELKRVQDNAYTITMPDGSVQRVYRDGDKVRTEKGTEVSPSIVRAEDLGSHSTWQEQVRVTQRNDELGAKHEAITRHLGRVREVKEQENSGELSAGDFKEVSRSLQSAMPEDVHVRYGAVDADAGREPTARADKVSGVLAQPFANAVSANGNATLSDRDFEELTSRPSASAPAPK